jgi:hypothetical protein
MFLNTYDFLINEKHVLEINYQQKINIHTIDQLNEELNEIIIKNNINKNGLIFLLDLSKVKSGDVNLNTAKKLIDSLQTNFPDFLHKCIVFNYTKTMKFLFNIIKSFMDKKTSSKIIINEQVNTRVKKLLYEQKFNNLSNN